MKNYIFYREYLYDNKIIDNSVLISKTKNSYLIGPIINDKFDDYSFKKRMISSSVFDIKKYRRCTKRTALKLIELYYSLLSNNEVIEIFKKGETLKHKIIPVPRGNYEKK